MPYEPPPNLIERAQAAIDYAQSVRRVHRRRTPKGNEQREADIRVAMDRLREAIKPIRVEIGRFPYGPKGPESEAERARVREASKEIQSERRKLWKMRQRRRRKR